MAFNVSGDTVGGESLSVPLSATEMGGVWWSVTQNGTQYPCQLDAPATTFVCRPVTDLPSYSFRHNGAQTPVMQIIKRKSLIDDE